VVKQRLTRGEALVLLVVGQSKLSCRPLPNWRQAEAIGESGGAKLPESLAAPLRTLQWPAPRPR
jgi:hypothetical protein